MTWPTLNWPWWIVLAGVAGCVLLLLFKKKTLFCLAAPLFVYFAVDFDAWDGFSYVFWGLMLISGIFFLFKKHPKARAITRVAGGVALLVAVLAMATAVVAGPFRSDSASPSNSSSEETTATADDSTSPSTIPSTTAAPTTTEESTSATTVTTTTVATTTATTTPGTTVPPDPLLPSMAALAAFSETISVDESDLRPQDRCSNANFFDNSLRDVEAGDPEFRQTTDAPSTPFLKETDELKELELYLEDCGNPTLGDMSIQGLDTFEDEVWGSIRDHNPWMTKCLDLAEELGLRDAFLDDNFQVVNGEWSLCAALVNKLIRDADLIGVMDDPSSKTWHLPGPMAGGLPRTELGTRPDTLPVLVFEYTAKDYGCVWRFGYNLQDKRFETFPCGPPEEPPCVENCGNGGTTTTTVPDGRKGDVTNTAPPPPTSAAPPPPKSDDCVDWGGVWYNGECRWLGDDSGAGAPEPEWPSWGPTPTSEPPGSVPPTSAPPGSGTTVAGP